MNAEPLEVAQTNVPLEVRGDQQSSAPIPTKEELLVRANELGVELRRLITEVKRLPRDRTLEPHLEEMRCLSQAQTYLQNGLMWMRRAIHPTKEF